MNRELWETENYPRFLEERQRLLAEAANALLNDLLHDAPAIGSGEPVAVAAGAASEPATIPGGIEAQDRFARGHRVRDQALHRRSAWRPLPARRASWRAR